MFLLPSQICFPTRHIFPSLPHCCQIVIVRSQRGSISQGPSRILSLRRRMTSPLSSRVRRIQHNWVAIKSQLRMSDRVLCILGLLIFQTRWILNRPHILLQKHLRLFLCHLCLFVIIILHVFPTIANPTIYSHFILSHLVYFFH